MTIRIEIGGDGRRRVFSSDISEVRAALDAAEAVLTKGWKLASGERTAIYFANGVYSADLGRGHPDGSQ